MEIKKYTSHDMNENCYEIKSGNNVILIDPGIENLHIEGNLINILLTHGHFDHILGIESLKAKYKTSVVIHEGDVNLLEDDKKNLSVYTRKSIKLQPDIVLKGSYSTICDFKAIHAPGHTPGSVCYYLEDKKILFTGDLLFKDSIGRTDFPGGDFKIIKLSIDNILNKFDEDTLIYPGHGDMTTIKDFKVFWQYINNI